MKILKFKKRLIQVLGDYLTYNRTEQRGVFVLSLILLGLVIANTVIPSGTFQKTPDFASFESEVAAFEAAWQKAADSDSMARSRKYLSYRNKSGNYPFDSMKYNKPVVPQVVIELNSADTLDLQQLRGIGPGFARRIVNYRERLRGFSDKRQVLEVFGMDTARYRLISGNLHVNPDSVHPFSLNTVTFKELLRHPYFPFAVTKNIMVYRQKNKVFKNLDELRQIEGINDSIFRRMVVYLRLGP
jgi:DNA uptake protein ComE-like DNA-binding protein